MQSPRFGDSVSGRAIETREQRRGPRESRWRAVRVNFRDASDGDRCVVRGRAGGGQFDFGIAVVYVLTAPTSSPSDLVTMAEI